MRYERLIYEILKEEEFKAKSKETGKVVTFKSKETMKKAIKGGSHEPLDKEKGKSGDVFAKDKPKDKQKMPGHKSRGMGTAVTDKYKEGDIVDAKIAIGDLSDRLSNPGKQDELVDLYGQIDRANRGMADDESWEAKARDLSPEVKQEIQDYADAHSDGAEVLKPVLDAMEEPEGGFGGDTGTDADFQGEPPEGMREPEDDSEFGKDYTAKFTDTSTGEYSSPETEEEIEGGIDNLVNSIQSDVEKDEAFQGAIEIIGDEESFKDLIDNIEDLQYHPDNVDYTPETELAYWVVAGAIDRDELTGNSDEMERQNFLANYEDDLLDRMMEESRKPLIHYERKIYDLIKTL